VQRRNQKVVEAGAPRPYLDAAGREAPVRVGIGGLGGAAVGYTHAGTVEFLMDAESGNVFFIEGQPAHPGGATPVTEQVTGIDIVKSQIRHQRRGPHRRRRLPGARAGRHPPERATRCNAGSPPKTRRTAFTPELWPHHRLIAARPVFGLRLDGGHRLQRLAG